MFTAKIKLSAAETFCIVSVHVHNNVQSAAQSRVLCGQVKVLAVVKVSHILTTCPYFDNLKFDIFDAGGGPQQGHFTTSVLRARSFPYVH